MHRIFPLAPAKQHKKYAKSDCASPYHSKVYIFRIYFMWKASETSEGKANSIGKAFSEFISEKIMQHHI